MEQGCYYVYKRFKKYMTKFINNNKKWKDPGEIGKSNYRLKIKEKNIKRENYLLTIIINKKFTKGREIKYNIMIFLPIRIKKMIAVIIVHYFLLVIKFCSKFYPELSHFISFLFNSNFE